MSDFKEWAMARKAQSLTGKERIAETYQETNARKKALQDAETVSTIKNAIFHIELPWNMENTTPYAAHLDSLTQSGSIVYPPVPNNRLSAQQQMESYQKTMNMFPNLNHLEINRDLALHPEKNTATDFYTNAAVDQLKQQAKAASSVPIEGAGTEKMDQPSVEGTNSVLDYAGYTVQKLGAGAIATVGSVEGGLRQTAQDLISGGKVSSDFQKIERFLQENPLERSMIDGQGRIMNEGMVQSIADRIGVLPASLQTYLITTEPERIDRSIEQSHSGLNDTYKSVVGQGAYMLGQQIPGLLLGAIAPVGQAGGIVKSAVGAARTGGARAALSAAAKSAVRGNLTTQLIGASSYSQSLQQNARQYGVRPETYADAIADGMVDAMTEGLFDNASVAALKNMLGTATGSASKTLMKQLLRYALTGAEEGLEEVVAGPLQGLSEKIFLDRDKKWFGDGGVFDVNQMMKDGVAGAAMGLLLGGIGSVVSAYDAIQTSRDIASNVEQINASAQKLDPEFRPETRNPASQTVESATEYAAEVLSGFAEQAQKMQQEARRVGASEADTSQPADSRLEQSQQKQGEARFSIQYDRDNNPYVLVEDDILEGVPRNEWVRTVKDNLRQMFPNGVTVGNNVIEINAQSRNEMTYSGYTKHLMRTEPELYADKLRAINNSDEVLRASRNYVNEALAHPRRDNIQEFARGEVLMQVGDKGYSAQVVVAMRSNGKLLLYDILQMEPAKIQINNKKSNAVIAKNPSPGTDRSTASGFNTNISEIGSGVNGNLAFRQTGERTELPPLRSRDDNTNSSSGVLWAGSESGRLQSGLAAGEYNAALSRQERRVLDQLAKDLRVRVEIGAPTGGQANGWYQDGTVHIAADAEDPFLVVGAHEITHRMQELAPEEYRRYRDYAVGRALEETGGLVEQYRDRYAKAGVELGIEEAMDEIAADYTRRLVEQPGLFEQMARDDRSLAQRILDALLDFLDRVRARFSSQQSRNEAAQVVYRTDLQTLEEAERLWRRAYDAASQQVDSLSTEQDNDTIDITRNSLKGAQNHERRKETRRAFLRRAAGEGYSIFEGDRVAYGYRTVQRESAQENAKQIQKEIEALGIDANIISGPILWNLDGITSIREVPQAVTIGGQHIFISNIADIPPRNVAGHEAFHLWKNRMGRTAYIEIVEDNLIFTSQDFLEYQSAIAEAYLGEEVDLSNDAQVRKLREELFAYISGDIHEGVNDAFMRPMFRDFDTVKSAWGRLVRENSDEAVNGNLFFGKSGRKTEMQQGLEKALSEKKRRFSLKSPIEGSADLIALHNLTEQNLLDALRLGGMPMPSIAVTKTDLPHLEFGDITLVLDKNSIDPGADSRNRVYGADIGSSIAPEEAQTLEEIVEAMKQSRRLPEGVGAMSLQAAVAPSYESLQQLWQDSGRLGRMEGPEFQADLEAVNRQIEEILRQVRQGQVDAEAADAAVALRNAAGSTKTEQAIAQSFAEDGYALDSKLVAQIQAAFQAAAELPTEYFEAKPERVVGFDEVLAAVVPDDSSRELLAGLDAVGVQTLKYRAGDDADRVEQVNSVQQARFSPGSAQKRTGRTNSDSGVIWAGSDTSQSASLTAAPLRQSDSRSLAGPPIAPLPRNRLAFSAAGGASPVFPLKGSQSNSSSGVLWAGSESGQLQAGVAAARWAESLQSKPGNDTMGKTSLKSLTEAERGALLRYKSSESYKVNAKLRDGITLTEAEQKMVAALDSALEKLPRVEGTVYRTLDFDDVFDPRKEYEDFIAQHAVGMFARYKAYTSASTKTDGYPLPDETKYGVTLEIVSQNARDLADIGNNFESEALFPRRSVFDISKVETDKGGRIRIYMEEVQVNGRDKHHEHDSQKRGVAVRDLQKAHSAHADLQGVPRADPRGDHGRGKNLQGTGEKVKFSLKSPVEESGDLIALHNLTEAEQRTISDAQARFSPGSAQRRTGRTNSDSGVLWRGSETAMDSPDQAVYNEAGKGQSTSSSNSSSGILWAGSDEMPHEGDSETSKNKISDNDSITGHIFRDAEGHIPDTPENRALLEDVANDPANFRGTDKYGNEWYTKIQSDGSQVWVESRNGNIFEGGINNTPKLWNLETGLKKP